MPHEVFGHIYLPSSSCLGLYVCAMHTYVYACSHGCGRTCVLVCACAHRVHVQKGQKLTLGVFFHRLSPYLELGLSPEPRTQ